MSLARVPFIIAVVIGQLITYTSPSPPTQEYERARVIEKEGLLRPTRYIPHTKVLLWAVAITEVVVVVTNHAAWLPASNTILEMLMMNRNVESLRLTPLSALGALVSLWGALIRLSCYRKMGKQFTFELSVRDNHKLITDGPYGVVRHPSYSGGLLYVLGVFGFYGSSGSWLRESGVLNYLGARVLIVISMALLLEPAANFGNRIRIEDRTLRKEFGAAWDEWAKKVPYRLIPGVY